MASFAQKISRSFAVNCQALPRLASCLGRHVFHPRDTLLIKACYVADAHGRPAHFNWGDDINYFFLSQATRKQICLCPDTRLSRIANLPTYVFIGSTITSFGMWNSTVWGAGLINDQQGLTIKSRPRKILAVRGPLTRQWLLDRGISCPPTYGDPALLLPQFYQPVSADKSFHLGVIPHYIDIDNPTVRRLAALPRSTLIPVQNYAHWLDFIDQINRCDLILSSSLHGLIVAEAYGIPAIWAEFGSYPPGWEFKFRDFYASVGKPGATFLPVSPDTSLRDLDTAAATWMPPHLDLAPLLRACPVPLHEFSRSRS